MIPLPALPCGLEIHVHPRRYASVRETMHSFAEIADGKHDRIPEGLLLNAGAVDEGTARFRQSIG